MNHTTKPVSPKSLALYSNGSDKLGEQISKLFTNFLRNMEKVDATNFQRVCMFSILAINDLFKTKDMETMDGAVFEELGDSITGKYSHILWLVLCDCHNCCIFNVADFFNFYRCLSYYQLCIRAVKLETHQRTCAELEKKSFQETCTNSANH